jgi:putative peptidoglycan lipid II flippase
VFCAVAFVVAGKPIVGVLFQRGEFGEDDTVFVWLVLAAYSLGLVGSAASRLFQNVCFAQGDVSGPARLAGARVVIAATIGAVLMLQFERFGVIDGQIERLGALPAFSLLPESVRVDDTGPQRLGAVGLALGSAVAAWIEYGLLRRRVKVALRSTRPVRDPARQLLPAAAGAAVASGGLAWLLDGFHPIFVAPIAVGAGGTLYVWLAYLRGSPSAAEAVRLARLDR